MTDRAVRTADLGRILSQRRREIQAELRSRIREGRADRGAEVRDELDSSEADTQGDLELALLQLRSEMLTRVDEALVRLDGGKYGSCVECADEISERRLRALPFAVRCQACEERREHAKGRARRIDPRHDGLALFSEAVRS